ncbi:hypothetical protein OOK58_42260 [Streptomyces sp. NBC_01728]|uniref:hypothetical protein n=1 Tax=unclassified Streptomyces TaxID=2593676 RepID=UPI002252532C|nr:MULTISPECIES: hypothetical protein [unclassified Streptomyces]MCX4458540.1 hypothetical protein [Streptomyces sp. NBC_01719]MCX4497897.1 hypothetical protein [Streptomyces sp. NBC_01728]
MSASHFEQFLTDGTNDVHYNLRLADGQIISIKAASCAATVDVYLPDEIGTPDDDSWELEDHWEAWLTDGDDPVDGRYFYEVQVADLRKLIEEHGGERADQSDPVTACFDQAVTDGTGTGRRPMLRIRLADGQIIAIKADAGDGYVDVYLPEAIEAPDSDAWEDEERQLQLTRLNGEPLPGRLFYEVPAARVRALIWKRGGEHADQANFA